jgi:hypothetical protein
MMCVSNKKDRRRRLRCERHIFAEVVVVSFPFFDQSDPNMISLLFQGVNSSSTSRGR